MRNKYFSLPLATAITASSLALIPLTANAGAKIEIGENSFVTLGAGMRFQVSQVEDAAPDGGDSFDSDLQSIRLYVGGQVNDIVKFTFNTERRNGSVDVLDAIAQFEFSPTFNIWVGRMLTPADRIEMNGPYYGLSWNQYTQPLYASDQDNPNDDTDGQAGSLGRDEGVTVWGASGKFQYALGFFDGVEGGPNQGDDPLFAARIAYNFLNMESNPGYYTSSTYHGGLGDIFTLGASFQSQSDGVGSVAESGDFSGYTIDMLFEKVMSGDDVLTVEAEYKEFDSDFTGASAAKTPVGGCAGPDGFCLFDGDSYFTTVAYLVKNDSAFGEFQPYLRFVENSPSDADSSDLTEAGVNYIISGHNARINFNYSTGDANISGYKSAQDSDAISIGVQIQI